MRIGVTSTASDFSLPSCPSDDCLDFSFGKRDADDAASDLLSYELTSMAVNAAGGLGEQALRKFADKRRWFG